MFRSARYFSVVVLLLSITASVMSQICQDIDQYARCSTNSACGCFHMVDADNTGVCGFLWPTCSQLESCDPSDNACQNTESVCVRHPRCQNRSVCYPVSLIDQRICPSIPAPTNVTTTTIPTITTTASTSTITTEQTTQTTTEWPFGPSEELCPSTFDLDCNATTSLVASCQSHEVSWNNHCYYLDGSNGDCIAGYRLASNAVLGCIAAQFQGKTYRHAISNSCCVLTADRYQCYGFDADCNKPGPFSMGPTLGGGGCRNHLNRQSRQLTLCESV